MDYYITSGTVNNGAQARYPGAQTQYGQMLCSKTSYSGAPYTGAPYSGALYSGASHSGAPQIENLPTLWVVQRADGSWWAGAAEELREPLAGKPQKMWCLNLARDGIKKAPWAALEALLEYGHIVGDPFVSSMIISLVAARHHMGY